ncbi:hypothetical protein TSAR_006178, partial [Trichomalopsis sarcophagae]
MKFLFLSYLRAVRRPLSSWLVSESLGSMPYTLHQLPEQKTPKRWIPRLEFVEQPYFFQDNLVQWRRRRLASGTFVATGL